MQMIAPHSCISGNVSRPISVSVLLASFFSASCVNAGGAFVNQEYGFKASIPNGLPVCVADTASHVHGVGTVLIGKDCSNRGRGPAFNIWADYNVLFVANALDVLVGNPMCSGNAARWAEGEWSLAIGGRKTAMCRVDHPDGRIDIVLAAQASKWPDSQTNDAPYINYTVYFNSTTARLGIDLQVLDSFLNSVEITEATQ